MADFHIRGRIERKGTTNYAAVVLALPAGEKAPLERMQAVCASRSQALDTLHELTVLMGRRIRESGGNVIDVKTDE